MHDIKLIREYPEIFDKALENRGEGSKSSEVIALDTQRRKTIEKLYKIYESDFVLFGYTIKPFILRN